MKAIESRATEIIDTVLRTTKPRPMEVRTTEVGAHKFSSVEHCRVGLFIP